MYYDRSGKPITTHEWCKRLESERRVALTELEPDTRVSTVWLGLEHGSDSDGLPLIFETMVFRGKDSWSDVDSNRYATEEQARAGHAEMVRVWTERGKVAAEVQP